MLCDLMLPKMFLKSDLQIHVEKIFFKNSYIFIKEKAFLMMDVGLKCDTRNFYPK